MDATHKQKTDIDDDKKKIALWLGLAVGFLAFYVVAYFLSVDDALTIMLSEHKFLFKPTIHGLSGGLLVACIVAFATYWFTNLDTVRNEHRRDVGGTGGFATKKELEEYNENYFTPDPPPITENLPVSYNPETDKDKYSQNMISSYHFTRPINSRALIGNNNVMIVGGAGTGKSRFVIKPNMLQMNASYVITDPSGEMIRSLGRVLLNHGYKIKVFNISDMLHSNCYNPLKYIRSDVGVDMVIDCLINNTNGTNKGGDDFWEKAEKLLYSACIHYLVDFCQDDSKKNFSGVMSLINASQVDENNANAKSAVDELFEGLPQDSLAYKNYRAFKQAAGKTLKSIIISCVTRLRPFLTPTVANLTRKDDLEIEKIGDEKTALFIITPQADRTFSFLSAMLYSQLFETLYFIGEQKGAATGDEQLTIPVRCMMDEFANIGTVPEFPEKLSTMRKYNISATIVLQDLSQIEAMYEKEWKTVTANCSTWIFLGTQEQNTLKYFSEQLGTTTIVTKNRNKNKGSSGGSFGDQKREVMTAEELGRLPADECIVFTQNRRPVRDKKYKYETHPYYKQTGDYNDEFNFKYKTLAEYDNSKIELLDNVLLAEQEAANYRSREKERKNKLKNLDNQKIEGNPMVEFDKLNSENNEELYQNFLMKEQDEIFNSEQDGLLILKENGINYSIHEALVKELASTTGTSEMILFSDVPDCNYLLGVAISNDENIKNRLNNNYVKSIKSNGNLTYIILAKNNYEKYKELVA